MQLLKQKKLKKLMGGIHNKMAWHVFYREYVPDEYGNQIKEKVKKNFKNQYAAILWWRKFLFEKGYGVVELTEIGGSD